MTFFTIVPKGIVLLLSKPLVFSPENTDCMSVAQWVVGASLVFSSFVLVMSSEAADMMQQAGDDELSVVSSPEGSGNHINTVDTKNWQGGATTELISEGEVTENAASQAYSRVFKPPVEEELEAVLGCSQL
jgi:hypothetical protein